MSLLHRRHRDHHDDVQSAGQGDATPDQINQNRAGGAASKVPRRRSSGLKFFASSVAPKHETSKESHRAWEAGYLKDLRANRPARPGGSRPLPERAATANPEPYARASSAMSFRPSNWRREPESAPGPAQDRCSSALSHRRAQSYLPDTAEGLGRPMVRQPDARASSRDFSSATIATKAPSIIPSGTYRESGMRWMEKQEARSLREALEDMDVRDEAKVHAAAQDEASELVWRHRNSSLPRRDLFEPYNYKQHLEKGAHARSQSIGWYTGIDTSINHEPLQKPDFSHSASSSSDKDSPPKQRNTSITFEDPAKSNHEIDSSGEQGHALWDSPQKKAYMGLASPNLSSKISGRRRSSGPRAGKISGGLFRNPDDRIYEEPDDLRKSSTPMPPEQSRIPAPLTSKTRNVISRISTASQPFLHSRITSAEDKQRVHRSEIHRNPPSQSRDPSYKQNHDPVMPLNVSKANGLEVNSEMAHSKDGVEIRSDDIKAATSMRMKDRSPKLPSPTVVSNRPGRPIVSFDQGWKPKHTENKDTSPSARSSGIPPKQRFKPHPLESTASAPVIPTINVPDPPSIQVDDTALNDSSSIPAISISETPFPSISLPDEPSTSPSLPPRLAKNRPPPASRPLPHHSATTPVHSSKLYWSPSSRRATAQCAACALPIEGRIVSAASQRFHPGCFTCHHCAEALECVAFYPEPDSARNVRLARIEARANGTSFAEEEEKAGETAVDDGDPSLRFYCHLDFHEIFSPRCRSCKTPIESEVVLACGASWHVGHFFCAQCGDPFDAKTPFVEKDGYAWCVGCHAGRFSGKCKGCRKPVVEGGVVALGGEWHADCFCCVVSSF